MPTLLAPPVIEDATRRQFLTLLGTAGLLAGCANDAGEDPESAAQPGYPRTIRDAVGNDVVLPSRPQRVVSIYEHATLDPLLALGVQPVAAGTRPGQELPSWTKAALAEDVVTFPFDQPPLERIAAAQPDLIVTYDHEDDAVLDKYRRIAPTLQLKPGVELELVAQALAAEDEAAALADEFAVRLAAVPAEPGGLTVFYDTGEGVYVFNPGFPGIAATVAAAGVPLTDRGMDDGENGFSLSYEELGQLDDDRLWRFAPYAEEAAAAEAFEANPLFARLPVVTGGRYRRLTVEQSQAIQSASVLSTESAVAVLTELLAE